MAAKLNPCIAEKQFIPAVIKNLSSLTAIDNIKCKLNLSQQERFKASCFGKLFGMPTIRFSGQIVHQLLLRQADHPGEDLWFVIGGKPARFSQNEFALITGLNCGQYPPPTEFKEMTQSTRLKYEYFNGQQTVNTKWLEQQFLSCIDKEDMFKLALIYFLEAVLISRDRKTSIEQHWLSLVDDLEAFNKFPWGKMCYERTILSLKKPLKAKFESGLKEKNVDPKRKEWNYCVFGFPYALQVWAYEAIPLLASRYAKKKKKKKANGIPRILCWKPTQTPTYKQLLENVFSVKNLNVLKTLRASELESEQDYMTSIAKFTYALDEKDEHMESGDGSGNGSDVNDAMEYSEIENSADSAKTVTSHAQQQSQADAGGLSSMCEGRWRKRKRAKAFIVQSSCTDPLKKQKTVISATMSSINPTQRMDTQETNELLEWLKNYNNMGRLQACERWGRDNSSMGNSDHSTHVAQETGEHHSSSTLTQPEGSTSEKPSHVVASVDGGGNILRTELNQPVRELKGHDSNTLLLKGSRELPFSLHLVEQLDAILQDQLSLDFCTEESSQTKDD